ncbi:MAG: RimK/LysX family protein [Marinobacter sp.]|uniref:ATP-dependent zinc protease n=1 Tax=Marinobacter sp. TaxID=50741 RepID=UPI0034A0413A
MKTGLALGLAATIALSQPAMADNDEKKDMPQETMGFVEWVVLQDTGLRMKARLDTGAKTSSLHAVNVEPFKKGDDEWVSFQIPLADHQDMDEVEVEGVKKPESVVLEFERPVERTVLIKRKGAPSQRRYVVRMEFCIGGSTHETQFSLTDRGRFSYPTLLGRRFLEDDNILVGSSDSFLAEKKCEYNELPEIVEKNED